MLREKKIIHIGKNLFPPVENNILEVTKVVSFEKKVRKHGCTFILEIIFFTYENKIFFHYFCVIQYVFYVLISLLIAVLVLSFLLCLFHKQTGVSWQCIIKAIFLGN